MDLYIATEDALSEAVVERLVLESGTNLNIAVRIGRKGNTFLKQKFPELARVAHAIPVLLVTDLDRIECPSTLISDWSNTRAVPRQMVFRVAVREVEAWLLADRGSFSRFTGIPLNKVPRQPETLSDPKQTLLNLVASYGKRAVQAEILPATDVKARQGFGYNQILRRYVHGHWSPGRAATNSKSLARACQRIHELGRGGGL